MGELLLWVSWLLDTFIVWGFVCLLLSGGGISGTKFLLGFFCAIDLDGILAMGSSPHELFYFLFKVKVWLYLYTTWTTSGSLGFVVFLECVDTLKHANFKGHINGVLWETTLKESIYQITLDSKLTCHYSGSID